MKKKLAVILALMLSVSALTACGGENAETESAKTGTIDLSTIPVEEYVTLGDYKNLTLNVTPRAELTEADLESNVMAYYYNDAQYLTADKFVTEGVVKNTDIVLIDYTGKKDGVAFDGGTAEDAVLGIGSNSFIDGFESGLIGVNVGDTVDLNLTFPAGYGNADLAGQAVVFTVKVKGLVSFEDATIAKFGITDLDTVEKYREAVESMLLYNIESDYYNNLSLSVCEALLECCTVNELPESIFENQKTYVMEQVKAEAEAYGYDGDAYTQMFMGMDLEEYAETVAEEYTKQAVIFQAIANAEGLQVTQEEADTFVKEYVEVYGAASGMDSVEAFYEYNTVEDVKIVLLQDKVVTFISENAAIADTE